MPGKAIDGRYEPMIVEMRDRVQKAVDNQKKLVWLDEVCFTKTSCLTHEWSKRKYNIQVPCDSRGVGYIAVLAAISKDFGFEHVQLYDEAVNEEKFMLYLRKLAEMNKRKQLVIVMDNLPVHKTLDVKALMRELKFEWIYVVPYSPEYNPIELPFGQIKK